MSTLYSDDGGSKAEDTETETTLPKPDNLGDNGGNEESDEATTLHGVIREELSQAQRYDEKGIREKARMSDKPYFWKEGILALVHNTPIGGRTFWER